MEKQRWEESERRSQEVRRSEKRKSGKQEDAGAKSRFTVFFEWFGASEGQKVTSLKRRVRSQLARGEMKKCTPLWREAHFQVKMYKTREVRTTFWRSEVEKVHAAVVRSTFPSQNESKCTKHARFGPLFDVQRSEKCTVLWREAHFQVEMYKARHVWATFRRSDVDHNNNNNNNNNNNYYYYYYYYHNNNKNNNNNNNNNYYYYYYYYY